MFTTSEQINEIAGALASAQTVIECAAKDRTNPAFRAAYATLASVDEAVRPHLSANGIAIIQATSFVRETGCVAVTTTLAHKSGQWFRSETEVPVSKQDAQGIGSATTYGRRYSLAAMCGVAPADDDDGEAAVGRGTNGNAPSRPATPVTQPASRPAQNNAPQVTDAQREENARKMLAVVREYGNDGDAEAWDIVDKQDKMAMYRRACAKAKELNAGFTPPV